MRFVKGSAAAVAAILVVSACGGGGNDTEQTAEEVKPASSARESVEPATTVATLPPTTTTEPRREFNQGNYAELVTDPDRWKSSTVAVVGKVFGEIERDATATYFQMYADPRNGNWNTIVRMPDPNLDIANDDYVLVKGFASGEYSGTNAFGGEIGAVMVMANSVEKTDATALAPAAIREVPLGARLNQHGLQLVIDKVQYAPAETRVLITVINGSGATASFYDFNAKATQGSRQFDAESSYVADYPEIQSELLPGVQSAGVLLFPGMDPHAPTALHLEARNDNYSLDFAPYVVNIPAG